MINIHQFDFSFFRIVLFDEKNPLTSYREKYVGRVVLKSVSWLGFHIKHSWPSYGIVTKLRGIQVP